MQHVATDMRCATGLEDLQLAYELENLRSLSISGCTAITPDALLVSLNVELPQVVCLGPVPADVSLVGRCSACIHLSSLMCPLRTQLFGQDPQFARTMTSLDLSRLPKLDDPSMVRLPLQCSSHMRALNIQFAKIQ